MTHDFMRFVEILIWPLIHVLWQASLVWFVLIILLWGLRHQSAQLRYGLACLSLGIICALPMISIVQRWGIPLEGVEISILDLLNHPEFGQLKWASENAWLGKIRAILTPHIFTLFVAWSIGVGLMWGRFILGMFWLKKIAANSKRHVHHSLGEWQELVTQIARVMKIRREVSLYVSSSIHSPITMGLLQPIILIPIELLSGMSHGHLRALIAHELAHIKRWDYLVLLLQNFALSFLFFHPAVWWITKAIEREREIIADEIACCYLGNRRDLAQALAQLAENSCHLKIEEHQPMKSNLSIASHHGDIVTRIRRLVKPQVSSHRWNQVIPTVPTTLALIICSALAIAQTPVDAQQKSTSIPIEASKLTSSSSIPVTLASKNAILIEEGKQTAIFEKEADEQVPIASISKLIAAWVISQARVDLNEKVNVIAQDIPAKNFAKSRLKAGDRLSRLDLIKLSLVSSDNAAATTLVRTFPGGRDEFINHAQLQFNRLHLSKTHFEDGSGMSYQNVSSAKEVSILLAEIAKNKSLQAIGNIASEEIKLAGRTINIENTNPLLKQKSWQISLTKTGQSEKAGACLAMRFERNNKQYILVLLNSSDRDARVMDANEVADWLSSKKGADRTNA